MPRPYVTIIIFIFSVRSWGNQCQNARPSAVRAPVMLNGHEYVACEARKKKVEFSKAGIVSFIPPMPQA
jgi:hypothetical protein